MLYCREDRRRVRKLFEVQKGFLIAMGELPFEWPNWIPQRFGTLCRCLSYLYCLFQILQTFHLALLFVKTTFDALHSGELDMVTDALTMVVIYSFACFATCYWLWRARHLREFLERVDRMYWHHSLMGLTYVSSYGSFKYARRMTIYWLTACIAGVVLWALAPIIRRQHTLPLSCWYPFDPLQPGIYQYVYLLQLLAQLNIGVTFGNGSALFVSIVVVMLGQLDVLFCSLKNFDYHARIMAGDDLQELTFLQQELPMGEDDEFNQYLFSVEHKSDLSKVKVPKPYKPLKSTLHASLVECVQMHRFVLESCVTLEELFNPYCLIKSLQITLQLCLLVFVGVAGERSMMRIINLIQYLALTLCELLMFTYCGELLRTHSVRVGEAFWRSQWWQNASLVRQDILILLVNSKRPVRLTAGKFYLMDIERLRSVITQAFSFFTLLQKLAAKNAK